MAPLTLSLKMASFTLQPGVDEPTTVDPTAGASEQADTDKSGTDPTKFLRTLKLVNEFQGLTTDNYFNITSLQYIQPFADAKMNLRVKVPLAWTDAQGDGETGLGDIQLRYNWLSYADTKQAVLLGAELTADSASEDVLGRGKWIISPLVTYAMFLNKNVIFAPTYQHNLSFAGDGDRGDVNESVLDFYLVMTADNKKSWVTIDPTLGIDWENDERMPFSVEVELGRNIGTLLGGALNAYLRPGIGIGQDRAYDWNIEIGFTIVGF